MTANGMVRPCSCPASKRSWQRGAKDKEHAMSQTPNTAIAVMGIDIGKNSFHVVGHDARGAIVLRQKWSRGQVEARLANLPPCLIGMEACKSRSFVPARRTSIASRAGAVKAGRCAWLAAGSGVARPRLDGAEHGARIKRVGRLHHRFSSARRRVL